MKITEVRIFPTKSRDGRLKAYAAMTFDDWFVVRNIKVIQGNGGLFVAMPSRKAMFVCPECGFKNVRGSKYCNDCGAALEQQTEPEETPDAWKQNDHMDIAHPIKQECRIYIQDKILDAFNGEMKRKLAEGESYKPVKPVSMDGVSEDEGDFSDGNKVSESSGHSIITEDGEDIEL
ncbi:MAG: SpoVG family protein [Candidatus Omnitrophica bacterium]|nr:SpoVG family protein [Candidatus Omnitrophota bacterium]MBU1128688.1 SpoVG family protein [Candidatus Omnitrophota bacterium]MBU1784118.1 SpoVG family protein [Candidatus Omnitrophota bacterium]MBU1850848.1 SpoVG family protein [Candidatus Omnitrophota bacterium]